MTNMIGGSNRETVERALRAMQQPVKLIAVTSLTADADGEQYHQCPACTDTMAFLTDLEELSGGKVEVEEISRVTEPDRAEALGVDRAPVVIFVDKGIRYLGAPLGMEAGAFVQTVIAASTGETDLAPTLRSRLKKLTQAKTLRTLVTLTCPYCPHSVLIANRVALASEGLVRSEVIEAYENADLAVRYQTKGVPVTIIDDEVAFTGVPPVRALFEKLSGTSLARETGMYG